VTAIDIMALPRQSAARRWPPLPVTLYLLAVLLPFSFKLGPLLMTSVRLFMLALILPMALRLLSGRCGRLMAIDALMVLHILWASIALVVNNPNQVIEQIGSVGLEFIGGYLVGRTCIRSREEFVAMARLLVLVVLCILPFTLYETLTGKSLMLTVIRALPGLRAPADLSIGKRMGLDRVQFTFVHPIHFGLFCSVVFSLCFVGLKGVIPNGRRVLSSIVIAASGFLALSSGALLAIILQIGLITWAFLFRDVRQRWWLLVGLFAVLYVIIDLLSTRTPLRVFMSYATFSAHTAFWRMLIFEYGMQNVWANPVVGLGLNDWVRPRWMNSGSMDNFWLVMGVRYGIPGFLFLAAAYLLALFHVMRRDFTGDAGIGHLRRAWVFTFVGLTFTLFTVHIWSNVYSFVFFMFGAGIWLIDVMPGDGFAAASKDEDADPRATRYRRQTVAAFSRFPVGSGSTLLAEEAQSTSRKAPPTTRQRLDPERVRPTEPSLSRRSSDPPTSRFAPGSTRRRP
jgi:O-antigen ligase